MAVTHGYFDQPYKDRYELESDWLRFISEHKGGYVTAMLIRRLDTQSRLNITPDMLPRHEALKIEYVSSYLRVHYDGWDCIPVCIEVIN